MDYTQDLYKRAQLRHKKVYHFTLTIVIYIICFLITTATYIQVKSELEAVHVEMNEAKNKSSLVGYNTAVVACVVEWLWNVAVFI